MSSNDFLGEEDPEMEPTVMPDKDRFHAYVGTKIIKARPMTKHTFESLIKGMTKPEGEEDVNGYLVEYPDNYLSWSPTNVFETAYRLITDSEKGLI